MAGPFDDILQGEQPPVPRAMLAGAAPSLGGSSNPFGDIVAKDSMSADIAKSLGTGAVKGVVMTPFAPLDITKYLTKKARDLKEYFTGPEAQPPKVNNLLASVPSGKEAYDWTQRNVTGPLHEPQGVPGQFAERIGEFGAGSALTGGMGNIRAAIESAIAPAVASETAGQVTKGTKLEPLARIAGGLAGGGAASLARGGTSAEDAIRQSLQGVTQQQFAAAATLMRDARAQGVNITWPEAIQQATNSGTTLGNLQRVVEGSQAGGAIMRPVMAVRPQEVTQAAQRQFQAIEPGVPMNPTQAGMRAQDAAENVIEGTRRQINAATEPAYLAAHADNIPAATLQRLHDTVPGFTAALAAVRANPHLNRYVANLPDTSVGVLNEVEKLLGQQGENMGRFTNPDRNVQIAASNTQSAAAVDTTARRYSADYRNARDTQAARRTAELDPLSQGPMGRLAELGKNGPAKTGAFGETLLPSNPLPNSAAETGRTVRALTAEDAQATRAVIRSRLEQQFQKSTQDLQSGTQEFGGANFRKAVYGGQQLRRNVRAALSELPNGAQVSAGFDRFMDIMQATGRRQQIGSQTEFNRQVTHDMSQIGPGFDAFTGIGNLRPVGFLRDRLQRWRLGNNLEELARIFTNPAAEARLRELAQPNIAPNRSARLFLQLAADLGRNASAGEK